MTKQKLGSKLLSISNGKQFMIQMEMVVSLTHAMATPVLTGSKPTSVSVNIITQACTVRRHLTSVLTLPVRIKALVRHLRVATYVCVQKATLAHTVNSK